MVGPPEERMIWGENSPKALRAYRRREWHNKGCQTDYCVVIFRRQKFNERDKNYERKTKEKHIHENNHRPTPTYRVRHLILISSDSNM
jgi:hypothetical protein